MRTEKHRLIVNRFPHYFDFDYCILGNFAYTTRKERFILDEFAMENEGVTETPGYHFNQVFREIHTPKKHSYTDAVSYPYKAIPCRLPYAFYVDIRHAYAQIANRFGINCSHKEGRYMAFGDTPFPAVFNQNKYCRALLVSGVGRKSRITEWKNGTLQSREYSNRHYSPMLSRAILYSLHAIQHAVSDASVYCHTDGFIIPFWRLAEVERKLNGWGLAYSIKHEGITTVYGVGSYDCGPHRSRFHHHTAGKKNSIRVDHANWWLKQLERSGV